MIADDLRVQLDQRLQMGRSLPLVACDDHTFKLPVCPAAPHSGLHLVQVGAHVAVVKVELLDDGQLLDRVLLHGEPLKPLLLAQLRVHEADALVIFAAIQHATAVKVVGEIEHNGDEQKPHEDARA